MVSNRTSPCGSPCGATEHRRQKDRAGAGRQHILERRSPCRLRSFRVAGANIRCVCSLEPNVRCRQTRVASILIAAPSHIRQGGRSHFCPVDTDKGRQGSRKCSNRHPRIWPRPSPHTSSNLNWLADNVRIHVPRLAYRIVLSSPISTQYLLLQAEKHLLLLVIGAASATPHALCIQMSNLPLSVFVFEFRGNPVSVQTGNVVAFDAFRTFGFAGVSVGTGSKAEFVHLAHHLFHSAGCFYFPLGQ